MDKPTVACALCLLFFAACKTGTPRTDPAPAASSSQQDSGPNDRPRPSDLDRPVDDLFAEPCEHDRKTFECDRCRYSVGVVRAPDELFSEGLLKSHAPTRERVAIPLQLNGEVRFDERRVTHVGTQAEGIVRRVFVVLGDRVKKGRPLVEIESVGAGEAEGAYLEALATLRLAKRTFERAEALHRETIAPEREFLEATQQLEAAEIRVQTARGKLGRLGVSAPSETAATSQVNHGQVVLRAPADGTVLGMHAVSGETARTNESLFTIGDNATVWVWADLYERDIARVSTEQSRQKLAAVVTVRAYPSEEFPGTVDFISPSMDETSRTVKVRIEVGNAQARLLAGMFATARVFLPGSDDVLTVPATAVLEDDGRAFVFQRHHADYYVRRPVSTGRRWSGLVEVTRGLRGDEAVVSEGAFLLKSDVLRSKMGAGCAD